MVGEENNAGVLILADAFVIFYKKLPGAGHGEDGFPVCQVFGDLKGVGDAAGDGGGFFAHGGAPG